MAVEPMALTTSATPSPESAPKDAVAPATPHAADEHAAPVARLGLPPDSDLVLVETRFAAAPIEESEAPRPRRARPPRVAIPDEPLLMVETHKQDSA